MNALRLTKLLYVTAAYAMAGEGGGGDSTTELKQALTDNDIANIGEIVDGLGWSVEDVLAFAHGQVLGGNYHHISDVLRNLDLFEAVADVPTAVAAIRTEYGDRLKDKQDDYTMLPGGSGTEPVGPVPEDDETETEEDDSSTNGDDETEEDEEDDEEEDDEDDEDVGDTSDDTSDDEATSSSPIDVSSGEASTASSD